MIVTGLTINILTVNIHYTGQYALLLSTGERTHAVVHLPRHLVSCYISAYKPQCSGSQTSVGLLGSTSWFRWGPETFCFWQVPRRCWYCWSGDHALRTALVMSLILQPASLILDLTALHQLFTCPSLFICAYIPDTLAFLVVTAQTKPVPISGLLPGMSSLDVSRGRLLQPAPPSNVLSHVLPSAASFSITSPFIVLIYQSLLSALKNAGFPIHCGWMKDVEIHKKMGLRGNQTRSSFWMTDVNEGRLYVSGEVTALCFCRWSGYVIRHLKPAIFQYVMNFFSAVKVTPSYLLCHFSQSGSCLRKWLCTLDDPEWMARKYRVWWTFVTVGICVIDF